MKNIISNEALKRWHGLVWEAAHAPSLLSVETGPGNPPAPCSLGPACSGSPGWVGPGWGPELLRREGRRRQRGTWGGQGMCTSRGLQPGPQCAPSLGITGSFVSVSPGMEAQDAPPGLSDWAPLANFQKATLPQLKTLTGPITSHYPKPSRASYPLLPAGA